MGDRWDKVREDHPNKGVQYSLEAEQKAFIEHVALMIRKVEESYFTKFETLSKKLINVERRLSETRLILREKRLEEHSKINSSFTENANNTTRCHTFKSLS